MGLTVIIPALNEAAGIQRAVESAWGAGACEVIVADGGSDDETVVLASQARAQIVASRRARAAQQNTAAETATGDILLFLHADNWLEKDAGRQIAAALANPSVLHGAFRQRIDAPAWKYRLLERGNAARVRWRGLPYGDQAIFIRAETFRQLGGFPDVPLMEDLILMQRLRRLAWPALLDGPVHVSPRRWEKSGIIRQTLRNWSLVAAHSLGIPPARLARFYPVHRSKDPRK